STYFDTLQIKADSAMIRPIAEKKMINFYYPDEDTVVIALNETTNIKDLNKIVSVFSEASDKLVQDIEDLEKGTTIPAAIERKKEYLTNEVFNSHHSETVFIRYIKKLVSKYY